MATAGRTASRRGDAEAQGVGQARIVHQIGEADDEHHGEDREPGLAQGARDAAEKRCRRQPDQAAVMIAASRIAVPVPAAERPSCAHRACRCRA